MRHKSAAKLPVPQQNGKKYFSLALLMPFCFLHPWPMALPLLNWVHSIGVGIKVTTQLASLLEILGLLLIGLRECFCLYKVTALICAFIKDSHTHFDSCQFSSVSSCFFAKEHYQHSCRSVYIVQLDRADALICYSLPTVLQHILE